VFSYAWKFYFEGSLRKPFGSLRNQFGRIGERMNKTRFYLKSSEQTHGLELGRMVKSIPGNAISTNRPRAPIFMI
jgi:hypothetical protein